MDAASSLTSPCEVCSFPWAHLMEEDDEESALAGIRFISQTEFREKVKLETDTIRCLGCCVLKAAYAFATTRFGPQSADMVSIRCDLNDPFLRLKTKTGRWFEVFILPGDKKISMVKTGIELSASTSLESYLPQIMEWMSLCSREHQKCTLEDNRIPPRLINVGDGNGAIRLVLAEELASDDVQPVQYAALSHCWGQIRCPVTTHKSNLAQNMREISSDGLTLTFRDALAMCKALGLRYIWIDSLCIVQDDRLDWKRHVALMSTIYGNASVTFGASASTDGDGGLFRHGVSEVYRGVPYQFSHHSINYRIYFREALRHGYYSASEEYEQGYAEKDNKQFDSETGQSWPLATRGWACQEYLLSTRFISFGPQEVVWCCKTFRGCPCSRTDSTFNGYDKARKWTKGEEELKFKLAKIDSFTRGEIYDLWSDVVAMFSGLRLTYPTDKLPAINGVAKPYIVDEFLAGMWKQNLTRALNWTRMKSQEIDINCVTHCRKRTSPSWSWISAADVGSIVLSPRKQILSLFTVLDVDVERETDSEYSPVVSGALTIEGILLPIAMKFEEGKGAINPQRLYLSGYYDPVYHPCVREEWRTSNGVAKSAFDADKNRLLTALFRPDYCFWTSTQELNERLNAAVLWMTDLDVQRLPTIWVEGTILAPLEDENRAEGRVWERIGRLRYRSPFDSLRNGDVEAALEAWEGLEVRRSTFRVV